MTTYRVHAVSCADPDWKGKNEMVFCGVSDKGRVRPINEDYYYLPVGAESFFAVADGMGGHEAGEVASQMAIEVLKESLRNMGYISDSERMTDAFLKANACVFEHSQNDEGKKGMGTTLTAILFSDGKAVLGHVGDSRAYLMRNGVLTQITTDHSFVEELVANGIITREQARIHPRRNLITRCIGIGESVQADVGTYDMQPDDIWLLCSDGLCGKVTDEEIANTLLKPDLSLSDRLLDLKDLAMLRGGEDNITILAAGGDVRG